MNKEGKLKAKTFRTVSPNLRNSISSATLKMSKDKLMSADRNGPNKLLCDQMLPEEMLHTSTHPDKEPTAD